MTKIDLMKQVDKHNKQTKFEECEKKKKVISRSVS